MKNEIPKKLELDFTEFNAYGNLFKISERKELIGEMLLILRKASGLTQSQIADYIGIKAGTYSTYENGTREAPAEIIVRLALLYDIPTDLILQKERFCRDDYEAQKQVEYINGQLQEMFEAITSSDNEINPQFAELMKTMTNAFEQMGDQLKEYNQNNKNRN